MEKFMQPILHLHIIGVRIVRIKQQLWLSVSVSFMDVDFGKVIEKYW